MAIASFMVPLATPAPDFDLPAITGGTVSLADLAGSPALLVTFLSNHCPYVRHVESALGAMTAEYAGKGLAAVGICSNDVVNYPDDGAEFLREQADRAGFTFPYLIDEPQQVAAAYRAACTPDFFLYDTERRLAYRGEFDPSRPRKRHPRQRRHPARRSGQGLRRRPRPGAPHAKSRLQHQMETRPGPLLTSHTHPTTHPRQQPTQASRGGGPCG